MTSNHTICIIKHKGREVGRISAASPNASLYIQELASHYGSIEVEHIEDETEAMVFRWFSPGFNSLLK